MIAAQVKGEVLKLVFKHERLEDSDYPYIVGRDAEAKAYTTCFIYRGPRDSEKLEASGVAYCSTLDNFSKETGRQIALKRAIERFDRETQGALLKAYFERKRNNGKTEANT